MQTYLLEYFSIVPEPPGLQPTFTFGERYFSYFHIGPCILVLVLILWVQALSYVDK